MPHRLFKQCPSWILPFGFVLAISPKFSLENYPSALKAGEKPAGQKDESGGKSSPTPKTAQIDSGRKVGDRVPTFYTRAVTGPLMNRSVCYVCRNGGRPVVMVFLRKLEKEFIPLLKQVDELVDDHRAQGLRSFGIYLSDDPSEAISPVQTYSFNNKFTLPLTVASDTIAQPHCQNLNEKADVTVVLYQKRRVVTRFAYRTQQVKKRQIKKIAESIKKLVKSDR